MSHIASSTPRVLLDDEGRIFAVLVGQPKDPRWAGECQAAANLMEITQKQCRLSKKQKVHRRGNFSCLSVGVSHGGGQKAPGNLRHNKTNKKQLDILLASPSIRRIAGFGSSVFAHYFPKLYANYAQTLEALFEHHPRLHRIFRNSIFPACTFNLGPDTVCLRHTDHGNKANGICHIHALGNYNPKTGGHIILYTIKRIIEFPPASSILIPSATVEHGNIPVQPHEKRFSFTQYAAGGLFRWVRYGFRTADALEESHDDELKAAVRRELDTNWQRALGLYSKVDDLPADRAQVFGN
ncbi:hypothetical protein PLICRDRAFT_111033 [Plicaturopsis crispa FD-325 SS-3]|nr:hypothetical protein PLICRDRAFT_111033 [Plicaturopsis crispa FD-325 SS-3]